LVNGWQNVCFHPIDCIDVRHRTAWHVTKKVEISMNDCKRGGRRFTNLLRRKSESQSDSILFTCLRRKPPWSIYEMDFAGSCCREQIARSCCSDFTPAVQKSSYLREKQGMPQGEQVHTLIIGGGQAGLAAGYYLKKLGLDCLILDAAERTGDSWRRRWDSLRLFTPSKFNGLPGKQFQKADF
jgi:hypothetical protein